MSTVKKCARCGLQNSFGITEHVVCSACGAGYQLCERCVPTWRNNKCPGCGAGPANAKWQVTSTASKPQHDMSYVGTATPAWQLYDKQKDKREETRNADGPGKHQGVALPPEQVTALRVIEDVIKAEIKPFDPAKGKNNTFVVRDGKVVELYLAPELQPQDNSLIEKIAQIQSLEGLAVRALSAATPLAPLAAMPGFKRLALAKEVRSDFIMRLTNDQIAGICNISQLEELNIAYLELDPAVLDQHIARLKNLKKLNINGIRSPQNDQFPKNIGQLPALEELAIAGIHNSMSKPVIPSGLENLPKIKLVHMDYEQNGLGILWGKLRAKLEVNNSSAYPKKSMKEKGLGFLKAVTSESKSMSDKAKEYQNTLPEPLKKGWSGIGF